jgi:polyribonucleotide nucleotidyltransferase
VDDDGTVLVSSPNGEMIKDAQAEISAICEEIKPGTVYNGKVVSVKDFGAFIEIAPGTDGMCHISELADGYVESVSDIVKVGDAVKVKVILVDDQGRIKLSRKQAIEGEDPLAPKGERKSGGEKKSGEKKSGERKSGGRRGKKEDAETVGAAD